MDSLVTLVRSSGASDSVGFISLLLCWIVFLAPISNVNLKLSSSRKHGDEIRRFQAVRSSSLQREACGVATDAAVALSRDVLCFLTGTGAAGPPRAV